MEATTFLLVGGAIIGGVALLKAIAGAGLMGSATEADSFGSEQARAWRRAAEQLGLTYSRVEGELPAVSGVLSGLEVRVDAYRSGGVDWTRIAVRRPPRFIADPSHENGPLAPLAEAWRAAHPKLRVPYRGDISRVELGIVHPGATLSVLVESTVQAVERGGLPEGDPLPWLLERAGLEPKALRMAAAKVIFQHHAAEPAARRFVFESMRHPDPWFRLRAAALLGNEGVPTLQRMAADKTLDTTLRERAYDAASAGMSPEERAQVLRTWLKSGGRLADRALPFLARRGDHGALSYIRQRLHAFSRDIPFDISAADHLRHYPAADAVPQLLPMLDSSEEMVRQAAVQSLGHFDDAARKLAEPVLLKLLASDDDDLVVFAADALGTLGTIAAVEPLMAFIGKLFGADDLEMAAETSIAAIKARAAHASAGQLAVVDPAAGGGLTVTEGGAGGGLSEAE